MKKLLVEFIKGMLAAAICFLFVVSLTKIMKWKCEYVGMDFHPLVHGCVVKK